MAEQTIIAQLRESSWRGIAFPFTGQRTFGFQHDQSQHRYIFRDQQLIESLGRQNPTYRYTIPFRDGIRQHGWERLFTEVYPRFLEACLDRSAGELIDSIHGPVRAKCASLQETLSVDGVDGVDVSADFIFAPSSTDDSPTTFSKIAKTLTGLQKAGIIYSSKVTDLTRAQKAEIAALQDEQKSPRVKIQDVGRAAAGTVQQTKTKTLAQLGSVTDHLERTQADIEEAEDPQLEDIRRESARLIRASRELSETVATPPGPYDVAVTTAEIGRMAITTFYQITIDAFMAFNPELAETMIIPKGTAVRIPRKDV